MRICSSHRYPELQSIAILVSFPPSSVYDDFFEVTSLRNRVFALRGLRQARSISSCSSGIALGTVANKIRKSFFRFHGTFLPAGNGGMYVINGLSRCYRGIKFYAGLDADHIWTKLFSSWALVSLSAECVFAQPSLRIMPFGAKSVARPFPLSTGKQEEGSIP